MGSPRQRARSLWPWPAAVCATVLLFAGACRSQPIPIPRVHKQVRGTVRANGHALAQAQVCAWRRGPRVRAVREDVEPRCTHSDGAGAYDLDLEVGVWQLVASAREHLPQSEALVLRASQTGLSRDFSLRPGGHRYGGRLVDLDGQPVADAQVAASLDRGLSVSTRSDANGQFELWAPADAYLSATAPGLIGMVPRGDTVVLLPESAIAGRVVDGAGKPVAGARVAHVQSLGPSFGFPLDATRTDAKGRFHLGGLSPDRYSLIAHSDEAGGHVEDIEVEYAQTHKGVEISLSTALQPLRARVVDDGGSPVAGCMVGIMPERGEHRSRLYAWTDEEGLLEVPSRDGRYRVVSLSCPDRIGAPPYAPLSLGLSGPAIPSLVLGRGQALRGRLLDAGGDPLSNRRVSVSFREPSREELREREELRARAEVDEPIDMDDFMPLWRDAMTDAEGRFEFPALPPGDFELNVAGWYRIGTPPRVTISADAPTEASFTMAATGRIELRSSRPGAGQAIRVHSCADPDSDAWERTQQTDAQGVAVIEHAPPGPLFASFRVDERALRCDSELGTRFEVIAGQRTQVTLAADPPPAPTLVRVQSPAGEPVANAIVSFRSYAFLPATSVNWWFMPETFVITDAQGLASVDPCDGESCSVTAASPGRFAAAPIAPGQTEVVIHL